MHGQAKARGRSAMWNAPELDRAIAGSGRNRLPIRGEPPAPDPGPVPGEDGDASAVYDVPHPRGFVGCRRQQQAIIGGERDRQHTFIRMVCERTFQTAGLGVPDPDLPARRAAGSREPPPVVRERDAVEPLRHVLARHAERSPFHRGIIPEGHLMTRGDGQDRPIGREIHPFERLVSDLVRSDQGPGHAVPSADLGTSVTGDQPATVRREEDHDDLVPVDQGWHQQPAIGRVPDLHRLIVAGGGELRAVGREPRPVDGPRVLADSQLRRTASRAPDTNPVLARRYQPRAVPGVFQVIDRCPMIRERRPLAVEHELVVIPLPGPTVAFRAMPAVPVEQGPGDRELVGGAGEIRQAPARRQAVNQRRTRFRCSIWSAPACQRGLGSDRPRGARTFRRTTADGDNRGEQDRDRHGG